MKEVDKNGDGFLNYEEFVRVIKKTSYNWLSKSLIKFFLNVFYYYMFN